MENDISVNFSTDSWLIITIVLMLITTIPVKLGASILGASYTSMKSSALAVFFGIIAAVACFNLLDGFTSFIVAYAAISIIYWLILKPSFIASFGLTFLVFIIQIGTIQGLVQFGMFAAS
jgi:hypothetical protein